MVSGYLIIKLTAKLGRTNDLMFIAKPIGICAIEIMDTLRQVGFCRFDKEMIMIIHETISMASHRIFDEHFF